MAMYRKLGKSSAQRKALLRNQVTQLLYHGKIVTTEARAKEVRKIGDNPSIAELEEELFPLDEENPGQPKTGAPPADADPRTLSEGGFL